MIYVLAAPANYFMSSVKVKWYIDYTTLTGYEAHLPVILVKSPTKPGTVAYNRFIWNIARTDGCTNNNSFFYNKLKWYFIVFRSKPFLAFNPSQPDCILCCFRRKMCIYGKDGSVSSSVQLLIESCLQSFKLGVLSSEMSTIKANSAIVECRDAMWQPEEWQNTGCFVRD